MRSQRRLQRFAQLLLWAQVAAASQQLQLQSEALPPADAPVYEWCYDAASGGWVRWMATIPEYKCDVDKPFASLIVPTADSVRCVWAAGWLPHLLPAGEGFCQHSTAPGWRWK